MTALAHRIHALSPEAREAALPVERPYPLPADIAATCGATP
ncbi:hypothetical protein [Herbidospora mongoliensis]|nr:hypothetical protein [Herbidospora mongoliensis]